MCLLCLTRGQNGPSILTSELPLLEADVDAFRHSEDTARIVRMMKPQRAASFVVDGSASTRRNFLPIVEFAEPGSPLGNLLRDWHQPYLA